MNVKKLAGFALGPVLGALLSLVTLPLLSWVIGVEDLGRYSLFQLCISLLLLLSLCGLDQAFVREYHEVKVKHSYALMLLIAGFTFLISASVVLFPFSNQIIRWLFDTSDNLIFLLIFGAGSLLLLNRYCSLLLRMEERAYLFSFLSSLPKVCIFAVVIFASLQAYRFSFIDFAATVFFAQLVAFVAYCFALKFSIKFWEIGTPDFSQLKKSWLYAWPLSVGAVSFWGLTSIDKVMLKGLAGLESLAMYSMAVSIASGAAVLQSVFSVIWGPFVYKKAAAGEDLSFVFKVSDCVTYFAIGVMAFVGMLSSLVDFILPEAYEQVKYLLATCVFYPMAFLVSMTTVIGLNLKRKTRSIMLATLLALVCNFVLNSLMIPVWEAKGAALASALSFILLLVIRTEFAIRAWKYLPRFKIYFLCIFCLILNTTFMFFETHVIQYLIPVWAVLCLVSLIKFVRLVRESKVVFSHAK